MTKTEIEDLYNTDCFTAEIVESIQKISPKINVSLYGDRTIKPYWINEEGKEEPLICPVYGEVIEETECFFIEVRYVIDEENDSIMCLLGFDQDEIFYIIDNFDDEQDDRATLISRYLLDYEIKKLFEHYDR